MECQLAERLLLSKFGCARSDCKPGYFSSKPMFCTLGNPPKLVIIEQVAVWSAKVLWLTAVVQEEVPDTIAKPVRMKLVGRISEASRWAHFT